MNKVVGVTKPIYELCRVLEDKREELEFSVFYSFAEILESHCFCPGFTFDGVYYEIQYNSANELIVLEFSKNAIFGDLGYIMTDEDIVELTNKIKELC